MMPHPLQRAGVVFKQEEKGYNLKHKGPQLESVFDKRSLWLKNQNRINFFEV